MSAEKKKELQVAALENGTAIDHIPPSQLFKVAKLLGLENMDNTITIGNNFHSNKMGSKGIKNENKELRERLDRQDQVKSQSELREKVIAGMKAKGVNDEYVLTTTLTKHGELDSKKSVDELVDSLLPVYDKEFSACRGNGAVPRTGQQQQQNTKNETLKRFKERHQKAGDLPVAN